MLSNVIFTVMMQNGKPHRERCKICDYSRYSESLSRGETLVVRDNDASVGIANPPRLPILSLVSFISSLVVAQFNLPFVQHPRRQPPRATATSWTIHRPSDRDTVNTRCALRTRRIGALRARMSADDAYIFPSRFSASNGDPHRAHSSPIAVHSRRGSDVPTRPVRREREREIPPGAPP